MNVNDLRRELACAGELSFLNYAATAPLLRASAEVMARLSREATRPLAQHFESWLALVESARRSVADTIGSRADEITFTTNTSGALSLVAGAVRWRAGDRVLYPADEFPSNRFVWDNLRELGVESKRCHPRRAIVRRAARGARTGARAADRGLSRVLSRRPRARSAGAREICRTRDILLAVDGIQASAPCPWTCGLWLRLPRLRRTEMAPGAARQRLLVHLPRSSRRTPRANGGMGQLALRRRP